MTDKTDIARVIDMLHDGFEKTEPTETCPRIGLPHSYWPQGNCQYCGKISPVLKEIREENDRLKGEIERLESLHRSEIADMAERFRSVNLSAALDLMPDNSALVVRAERAEASCEAMAKALEPFAAWNSSDEYIKSDAPDDGVCAGHSYTAGDYRIARQALAEYRKETGE